MPRKSIVISISLSPEERELLEDLAEHERRTRSEVIREAFHQYLGATYYVDDLREQLPLF